MLLSFFDKNSLRKTKLVPGREIEHKSLSMQLNLPLLFLNEFSANFQVKLSWTLNFHRYWCAFQFSNTFFKLTSNHHNFNFKFRSVKEKISLFYLCNFWCANWRKITSMLWKNKNNHHFVKSSVLCGKNRSTEFRDD